MSDYEKHLEKQNEELREKLAITEAKLQMAEDKLKKFMASYSQSINDLVSVQPMVVPTNGALRYKIGNTIAKAIRKP